MTLDYKNPDYASIYRDRAVRLARLNAMSEAEFGALKLYYADHIADFMTDWGMTVNPKNAGTHIPVVMPFILFPKQREWIDYVARKWQAKEDGLTEKSRDIGISWLSMGFAVSMCVLRENIAIGFGSAKEEAVDASGDPDALFYKGRMFMQHLPARFKCGWDIGSKAYTSHMRILFPSTKSTIIGKSGDNIGRGGRTTIFFVDESCHIERPKLIDAALIANTDCRQDMSSVNGMANSFAEKRHSGKIEVFTFSWRDDPRRDEEWAAKKRATTDPVIWAAEYEISYNASVEGVIVPFEWVQAAVGLHEKLGIKPTGARITALDVADRGADKNAMASRKGRLLDFALAWSGAGSDIYATTAKAFTICDERGWPGFEYDADGLGAGVRGDARVLNEHRTAPDGLGRPKSKPLRVNQFRGSAAVVFPERLVPKTDRKNEDMFANYKAQSWWNLRFCFYESFKASRGEEYDEDAVIFIDRNMPDLTRIMAEISQPIYKINNAGKIVVDKQPDDTLSPNYGDAVMMTFAPRKTSMVISDTMLENV